MDKNDFHRTLSKQVAAWLALFAIVLVVVAPLISIFLRKDTLEMMPGMMHHHTAMLSAHHVGQKPVQMPDEHTEACGYCLFLTHVPGLPAALAGLSFAQILHLCFQLVWPVLQVRHFFFWLYPHTRAPPQISASTY